MATPAVPARLLAVLLVSPWLGACGDGARETPSSSGDGGAAGLDGEVGAPDAGGGGEGPPWRCSEADFRAPAAAPPSPWLVDVTADSGLAELPTYGFGRVLAVDLDGDGWDDVVGTPAHDGMHTSPPDTFDKLVLRNRGDGTFEDFTAESGLGEAGVGLMVFGDVDGDGDQDMFGGVIEGRGLDDRGIWLNDGAGRFTHAGPNGITLEELPCGEVTCTPRQIAATLFDADGDGHLDLYVGGWFWADGASDSRYTPPPPDHLFLGNGDGTFAEAPGALGPQAHPRSGASDRFGRAAMGVSPGDYDGDGDLDLFVANYGAGRPTLSLGGELTCSPPRYWDQNLLWRNDGGRFENVGDAAGVAATMRGVGDITSEPPLVIGEECPADVRGTYPSPIGGNSFTSHWGDFDNDGDLDLVVGSIAHPDYVQSDPTLLFVNQGPPDFAFVEESLARGLRYREDEKHVLWVDVDNDGRLDLSATGLRNPAENELRIYRQGEDGRFELAPAEVTGVDDRRQETILWLDFDRDGDLDL